LVKIKIKKKVNSKINFNRIGQEGPTHTASRHVF